MQSFIVIDSPLYIPEEQLPPPDGWSALLGNDHPLSLEIGCGIGDFIAAVAAANPDRNYIALDFYNKGCWKTCKRLERQGLSNVRVVRAEARSFIAERLPPESLATVYINCPDPWPKKRHRKRRLVSGEFADFLRPFLSPAGELHFATDFDDYGIDVAGMMAGKEGYENLLAPDLYRHDLPGYPLSKYMRKFLAEGKQIYFIHYRKVSSP